MAFLQENYTHPVDFNATNGTLSYKSELENIGRGLRIKFHRLEQKMSLKELASGNLSQENLRLAEMSQYPLEDKIYKKLCLRLGIPIEPVVNPIAETGILKFKSMLTHIKKRSGLVEQYAFIMDHPRTHLKEVYRLELMVHSIRYFVVTGDVATALSRYAEVEKYKDLLCAHQMFFLNKYRGNIFYAEGRYKEAMDLYKSCLASAPLDLPDGEMADLLYTLGISAGQLVQPQDSKIYSEKALSLYQDMFYPKRIAECHVCISLAEHRSSNFKSGMNHLTKASLILEEVELPELRYLVEYNFGYSYLQFQDFHSTIRHTEKCLEIIESGNVLEELRCYTMLIKANWQLGRKNIAENWCSLGVRALRDMETLSLQNPSVSEVYNQFQLMKSLLKDDHDRIQYFAEQEVLPHFEKDGYEIDHAYYCTMLADYYKRVGMTDRAIELYQQSGEIYRKALSIF